MLPTLSLSLHQPIKTKQTVLCHRVKPSLHKMEITAKLPKLPTSLPPIFFHSKASHLAYRSVPLHSSKSLLTQLQGVRIITRKQRNLGVGAIQASVAERWLLEPVGDGDSRHIGFKVQMPDAFEIVSSEVTVGRLPDKADMVIPVATVSGLHARIQKKEGSLLVTDLDSTNGTFINELRLRPGIGAPASSGSCITFGDIHLAIFRVSKLENVENVKAESKEEGSENKLETETANIVEG